MDRLRECWILHNILGGMLIGRLRDWWCCLLCVCHTVGGGVWLINRIGDGVLEKKL